MSESGPTREAYYRVLADCVSDETLVVTSLGNASCVWSNVRDRPENFYLEDAMGLALPLALDLAALARSAGIDGTEKVGSLDSFRTLLPPALAEEGPTLLVLATEPDIPPAKPAFPMNPPMRKQRFMDAIGAPRYVPAMFRT